MQGEHFAVAFEADTQSNFRRCDSLLVAETHLQTNKHEFVNHEKAPNTTRLEKGMASWVIIHMKSVYVSLFIRFNFSFKGTSVHQVGEG